MYLRANLKDYSNQHKKDRKAEPPKCLVFYRIGLKVKTNISRAMPTRRSTLFISLELLLDLDVSTFRCSSSVSYCLSEIPHGVIAKGTASLPGGCMSMAWNEDLALSTISSFILI